MKSNPYEMDGKLFRYDFDRCVVEYIAKASAEDIADEAEWKAKYGHGLLGIGDDGYMVVTAAGLMAENWEDKEARDEYLSEWAFELDEESSALAADFVKYALPYLSEEPPSSTAGDYSPSNPWDAPGMSIKNFI